MKTTKEDIRRALNKVYDEIAVKEREEGDSWFRDLIDFFKSNELFSRILVIVLISAIIIFALYQIYQHFGPAAKKLKGKEDYGSIDDPGKLDKLIQSAVEKKEYSNATLLLHYQTIRYLRSNKFLELSRDYTNREVNRILDNTTFRYPFYQIATLSQEYLFDNRVVTEEEFTSQYKRYKRVFK